MEQNFIKMVLVGDKGVGKTQILNTYCFGLRPQEHPEATIGCDYVLKRVAINDQYVKLQIWEVAGAEYGSSLLRVYLKSALGVLFVCDTEKESTKNNLINWRNQVMQYADEYGGRTIPFMIVQNKMDIIRYQESSQSLGSLQQFASSNGFMDAIQISAYENMNLSESFETLVDEILRRDLVSQQMKRHASRINKLYIQDQGLTMKSQHKCF